MWPQIAYYQKFVDEHSKNQLKQALIAYDRTLLVADSRRCEPKKFGGPGARARYQVRLRSIISLKRTDLLTPAPRNRTVKLVLFVAMWKWATGTRWALRSQRNQGAAVSLSTST